MWILLGMTLRVYNKQMGLLICSRHTRNGLTITIEVNWRNVVLNQLKGISPKVCDRKICGSRIVPYLLIVRYICAQIAPIGPSGILNGD